MRQIIYFFIFFIYTAINCYPTFDINGDVCSTCGENASSPSNVAIGSSKPPCEDEKLVAFLADIQIINPESIVEWAIDDLEPMCRKICRNLRSIDNYLSTCDCTNEDNLYASLIDGVKTLRQKLCTDSEFVKRYFVYYPCLHELKNDFEACDGPADWNENEDTTAMCNDYKDIIDCYYIKAAKVCGYKAADTLKELIKDVINSVIQVKCSRINRNPYVEDPMPESYINIHYRRCNKAHTIKTSGKLMSIILVIIFINYY